MCRWAGATRACCSDRLRSSRCIFAASRCFRRKALRSPPACSPSSTRWCSCSRGSRCWIYLRWRSACWRSRRSCTASARYGRIAGSRSPASHSVLSAACKWSGLFALAVCIVIVAVIRLMQGWRTQFADGNAGDWYRPGLWPDFSFIHFAACFVLVPAVAYLATFVPLYGLSLPDLLEAQRRIFGDNTTTAIAGPHLYERVAVLAVSGAAGLVSVRKGRRGPDCGGGVSRQSAGVVGGAAGARGLPARLDRDAPGRRVPDPVVLCRALSGLGAAAADARLPVLLFAGRHLCEPCAGLCAAAGQQPALAVMGFRRGRRRGLRRDAADHGGVCRNVDGDVCPADAFRRAGYDGAKMRSARATCAG